MELPSIVSHLDGLETLKANLASILSPGVYAEYCKNIDSIRNTIIAEIQKTPLPDLSAVEQQAPPHLLHAMREFQAIQSGLPTSGEKERQAFIDGNDWSGFGIIRDAVDAPDEVTRVLDDRFDFQDWAMTASGIGATTSKIEPSPSQSAPSDLDLWMKKPPADPPPADPAEPPPKKHSHLDSWLNESES